MSDEKKKVELKALYRENIEESFNADKETGVYIHCEFDVDLAKKTVMHTLSSTNGTDVVIIQHDEFPYTPEFRKEFIDFAVKSYATYGVVTVLKSHNHAVDQTPLNAATLKTISSMNNIMTIKTAEVDYIKKIEEEINRLQGKKEEQLKLANKPHNGIVNAIILAFLVGIFDGSIMMLLLKFVIK